VCIIATIDGLKLSGARVNWWDQNAPVNDYDYATSGKGCKVGYFDIYGRGWSMKSPTRDFCQAGMDGISGDGYNFDTLRDTPRTVQEGELVCGRFFLKTPTGFREWGKPACEAEHAG
jgi:hypothetical protein